MTAAQAAAQIVGNRVLNKETGLVGYVTFVNKDFIWVRWLNDEQTPYTTHGVGHISPLTRQEVLRRLAS